MRTLRLIADRVEWRSGDRVIAVDAASSDVCELNAAGRELWPLLVAGTSIEAMAQRLVDVYNIAPEAALHDAQGFVAEFETRGLIEGSG